MILSRGRSCIGWVKIARMYKPLSQDCMEIRELTKVLCQPTDQLKGYFPASVAKKANAVNVHARKHRFS